MQDWGMWILEEVAHPRTSKGYTSPKHLIHASTVPWKGRSFTSPPPQRDSQGFFQLTAKQEDEEHSVNPC